VIVEEDVKNVTVGELVAEEKATRDDESATPGTP
jgi:hypothetical protein